MNDEPVKVLYFVDRMLRGGIQSLVIDWVSRFDKQKIHVDFLLLDDGNKYELEDKLKELGCNVYKLKGIWIRNPFDYIKYAKAMNNYFKNHHDYKVVHMHSSSKNYMVLKYAKKYGIPIRIAHSHSTGFQTKNKLKTAVGNYFKKKLVFYATNYFACSKLAGIWLFGDKIVRSDKFTLIKNAVDYDKFKFNKLKRNEIRKELGIQNNQVVIGHVGRFVVGKNHKFLIDIFNEYHKLNANSKLILIGTGELEEAIKHKVFDLGLEDDVIFCGFKENVSDYMQAMDLFLLPSIYEGLPVVGIEAQASGLNCYMSDSITREVKVTNNVYFISLSHSAKEWATIIKNHSLSRNDNYKQIRDSGYTIESVINKIESIYLGSVYEKSKRNYTNL